MRKLAILTTFVLCLAPLACDKQDEKKSADKSDKKADDKAADKKDDKKEAADGGGW